MKRSSAIALVAAMLLTLAGCSSKGGKQTAPDSESSTAGTAVMVCDASFENIMQQEIDVFEFCYPYASILPYYIDEFAAMDSLIHGNVRLAVVTRELTRQEAQLLREKKRVPRTKRIAVDAVAVIVNPNNPIENISMGELKEVLSGKITEWNELAPSKLGKIQVIFDHNGSSVVKYMADSVLKGDKYASNVFTADSMSGVFNAVKDRKNAIGVVGVSWISSDLKTADLSTEELSKTLEKDDTTATTFVEDVKVLAVRNDSSIVAYKPYQAYIFSGQYPLYRSIYMICTRSTGTPASGFFSFVTSFQGQKLIQTTGVLPGTVYPRMVAVE